MKEFNIAGTCIPSKHYMVDISKKIDDVIVRLIKKGKYFTINRPRQYGKTTTMYLLDKKLKDDYTLLFISFEGLGEVSFENEKNLSQTFINLLKRELKFKKDNKMVEFIDKNYKVTNFEELNEFITDLILEMDKKVILMIDEVDKNSNNQLFLHFIGMLRDKYLKMNEERDYTFHNVILAGVHDVKNMKLKLRQNEERQYNSPWNIAVDFDIDMSFSIEEIKTMLEDYEKEIKTGMNIDLIAKKLREFTSGYPFLVSKLCKTIDEKLNREFTEEGLEKSMKLLLDEKNTLFDDVIKNIENNSDFKRLLEELILEGKKIIYNVDAHELGLMYGILKKDGSNIAVSNKIFEIRIYNYLLAMRDMKKGSALTYEFRTNFIDENGNLMMKTVLRKFQELMKAEYRDRDKKFIEREGRLLFLSFLRPIINGVGFYFVEPETRQDNRMDIVVTYNRKKYIIELKIWHGKVKKEDGEKQLASYLESQSEEEGYLVLYSFNKKIGYTAEDILCEGKKIFEVVV